MGNPDVRVPERADEVSLDLEADLLCAGGSLAGFTTALHAHELGAKVVVLEKGVAGRRVRSQGFAGCGSNNPVHAGGRRRRS